MTYEQIDFIADLYIPTLFVFILALIAHSLKKKPRSQPVIPTVQTAIVSIAIVYTLMFVDLQFRFWPTFGLDYSTHTALGLALSFSISLMKRAFIIPVGLSFVAYCGVMLYQGYHSVLDIVTTIIVVLPLLLGANFKLEGRRTNVRY